MPENDELSNSYEVEEYEIIIEEDEESEDEHSYETSGVIPHY